MDIKILDEVIKRFLREYLVSRTISDERIVSYRLFKSSDITLGMIRDLTSALIDKHFTGQLRLVNHTWFFDVMELK